MAKIHRQFIQTSCYRNIMHTFTFDEVNDNVIREINLYLNNDSKIENPEKALTDILNGKVVNCGAYAYYISNIRYVE